MEVERPEDVAVGTLFRLAMESCHWQYLSYEAGVCHDESPTWPTTNF